jgi:hypothetical protein
MSSAVAIRVDVEAPGRCGVERDLPRRTAVDHAVGGDLGIEAAMSKRPDPPGARQDEDTVGDARAVNHGFPA